jgi:hypothetical protein
MRAYASVGVVGDGCARGGEVAVGGVGSGGMGASG